MGATPSPVAEAAPAAEPAEASGEKKPSVDDILSMIRNRETTGQ
jgi:hypothetical protein